MYVYVGKEVITTVESYEILEGWVTMKRELEVRHRTVSHTHYGKVIVHHPHAEKGRAPRELILSAGREYGPAHTVRYAVGQDEQYYQ